MAYSFPPNPTVGQTYASNGRVWKWSGVQWSAVTVPTPPSSPVYISVSPPPNPVSGSLWYDSNNSNLNIWYIDLNGGQWVSVVPYPENSIDQNGGVFGGAIYAQYEIPNNPAAFVTVGWVKDYINAHLAAEQYIRAGNGVSIDSNAQITNIDNGLVV
jgi:hypothetical protein